MKIPLTDLVPYSPYYCKSPLVTVVHCCALLCSTCLEHSQLQLGSRWQQYGAQCLASFPTELEISWLIGWLLTKQLRVSPDLQCPCPQHPCPFVFGHVPCSHPGTLCRDRGICEDLWSWPSRRFWRCIGTFLLSCIILSSSIPVLCATLSHLQDWHWKSAGIQQVDLLSLCWLREQRRDSSTEDKCLGLMQNTHTQLLFILIWWMLLTFGTLYECRL